MTAFSVLSSSTSEVVKALQVYLTEIVPSDFASLAIDAEKPHKWSVSGTIFVDYVPLRVEVCAKSSGEDVAVTVTHTSHKDVIKFSAVCSQMVAFLQRRGLQAYSNLNAASKQMQLLDNDDDFDFSDDEEPAWEEKVQAVMEDTSAIRSEVREEAFRAIAQWASSSPASHEALARAFIDRAGKLSVLFSTRMDASVAETYPFAVAMHKLSEGCSAETRESMLKSPLSSMMDPESKPSVPAVVAREFSMAMKVLGKVEVTKPFGDFVITSDTIGIKDQAQMPMNIKHTFNPEASPTKRGEDNFEVEASPENPSVFGQIESWKKTILSGGSCRTRRH